MVGHSEGLNMLRRAPWLVWGWLFGAGIQLQQSDIWPVEWVLGFGFLGALLFVWSAKFLGSSVSNTSHRSLTFGFSSNVLALWVLSMASCSMALAVVNARCIIQAQDALAPALEGVDLSVTGMVSSLPQRGPLGIRFQFKVNAANRTDNSASVKVPAHLDLAWYDPDVRSSQSSVMAMESQAWDLLEAGDQWQFNVRLKAPHGTFNPGGFDYELWLWEQGLGATGTVRTGKRDAAPQKLKASWYYPVTQARQRVRAQIDLAFTGGDLNQRRMSGIISALVMGDQAALTKADWEIFRATGVAHLMSISGLHITLFAWVAAALIGFAWRWSARQTNWFCLRWPAPYAGAWGGVICATLYALFSGWGLPAQRTVIMLIVVNFLRFKGGQWPWLWIWGAALWWVVFWDPWALLQAGFWLSFVAVGVLIATDSREFQVRTNLEEAGSETVHPSFFEKLRMNRVTPVLNSIVRLLREQWVVTLALTPLSIFFFGQISGVGLLANLVAIPWVTWVVTPLAMAGVLWSPLWHLAAWTLQPLLSILNLMTTWHWVIWNLPVPPITFIILSVAGGLLLMQKWPWTLRCWGLPFMLPALMWQMPQPAWGQFDLWAMDVGQGNAVLLKTRHHALLYDAGPQYSEESDAGQRVLAPFMTRMGVHLDKVILSHRDLDHTGGAVSVLNAQKSADLLTSLEPGHPLTQVRTSQRCEAGQKWEWDGVRFEILHPMPSDYERMISTNSLSCVFRVDARQVDVSNQAHDVHRGSALLTGDIEAPQEIALLQANALQQVDFLLVPHHGSKTSSIEKFVETLKPSWAMVQSGYRNRYGHPAPQVVARYEAHGVPVVQTAVCGAAYWQSSAPKELACERDMRRRYWHHK